MYVANNIFVTYKEFCCNNLFSWVIPSLQPSCCIISNLVVHTYFISYIIYDTNFVVLVSHGAVFGIWSANASVGNIIGAFLVSINR